MRTMRFECRLQNTPDCHKEIAVPIDVPLVRAGLDAAGWFPALLTEGWYCPTCGPTEYERGKKQREEMGKAD